MVSLVAPVAANPNNKKNSAKMIIMTVTMTNEI